jgi:23S rRNA (guanosine2251-2'-O)-methyltransferase
MKKPKWVVKKEQDKKAADAETVWLFGLHAVRDALMNPERTKLKLVVTRNAMDKLSEAIAFSELEPEMCEPRKFNAPLDPQSVHQGAALEVKPLTWGRLEEVCIGGTAAVPRAVLLDRVTDPHNVGAILRSAEVFGASAVIGIAALRQKRVRWLKPRAVRWSVNLICAFAIWPKASKACRKWATS